MIHISPSARQPSRQAWSLDRLIYERSIALGMTLHPNTQHAYSSHLNSYLTFCKIHRFPILPTPDTLSFFIVFMSHYIRPRSVENYLSGIVSQLQPYFPDVRDVHNSDLVRRTLRGCLRRFARPVSRRQPLSREHLLHALTSCSRPFLYDDLCWLAMLLCGFFGLLRLGELVWPDASDLRDYARLSSRSSVSFDASSFTFCVPQRKSDTLFEGHLIRMTRSHLPDDPFSVFMQYLAARDSAFPLHPFLWLRSDGPVPTRTWFLERFRNIFPDPSLGGHSLLVSHLPKSKPLADGPHRHGSATFVKTLFCYKLSSSMGGPYMTHLFLPSDSSPPPLPPPINSQIAFSVRLGIIQLQLSVFLAGFPFLLCLLVALLRLPSTL